MGTPQYALICDTCRENRTLTSYCVDCHGSMCIECTKNHQTLYADHISLPMAESKCPDHLKFYSVHCKMCDKPICRECLTGFHNGHKYSDMNVAKQEKLNEVKTYMKNLHENICPLYQSTEDQGKRQLDDYASEIEMVKIIINEQREKLKSKIDELCNSIIYSVETTLDAHSDQLKKELSSIVDGKTKIENEIKKCKDLTEKGILEIKEFLETLPHLQDISDRPPALSKPVPSKFFPAEISEIALKQMIGSVLLVRVHNSFTCKMPVSYVQACLANEVWVNFEDEKKLTKYSYQQNTKMAIEKESLKLDFKPECFLLLKGDCLLASDRFNHCIWKIDKKRKPQSFIKMSPNNPKGLCLNNRQELVVCLSGLTGCLRVYQNEKTYREIGNDVLNAPRRVAQNGDENYIVLDDHLQSHFVVAIDPKGNCKWKFDGLEEKKLTFSPKSVCCDSLQNIIVSDFGNHSILLLDKNGKFLMNLLCSRYGLWSPQGMCLDSEGKLWVGQGKDGMGECHVVQYIK
ncbi:E3 ubiquitin-protein ligase TRIM71 [Magallana gigas]|uniref:E3 ubiquitin-protein ligase TRIM71 n=1 Tax=Magallana gigas TaxID=29159 RepID=UPI00333E2FFB